jgi:hypothetical protein
MFPYTHPSEKKGIKIRFFQDIFEQLSMEGWSTGSDDDTVETMLPNTLLDHVLARLGAHKGVIFRDNDVRKQLEVLTHLLHIDGMFDIVSAMTDENTGLHDENPEK